MAKRHYKIDSRKKAQIKQEHGKTVVTIEDVVMVEENHNTILDYENFVSGKEYKKTKCKPADFITIILYGIATFLLLGMHTILGICKDYGILSNSYVDNMIGIAALLFAIISIPKIKEQLGKKLTGHKIANKLWYFIMILCFPFYAILFMHWMGLENSVSNACGIIGIIICILTW